MDARGHERYAVVEHDRGARAVYRMAVDHPERVRRRPGSPPAPKTSPPTLRRASNNIVRWSDFDRGDHLAAIEAPDLIVGDVCDFFRRFR